MPPKAIAVIYPNRWRAMRLFPSALIAIINVTTTKKNNDVIHYCVTRTTHTLRKIVYCNVLTLFEATDNSQITQTHPVDEHFSSPSLLPQINVMIGYSCIVFSERNYVFCTVAPRAGFKIKQK